MSSFEPSRRGDLDTSPIQSHAFGTSHEHKSAKTLLGVAVLIVLSFAFYELGGKAAGDVVNAPTGEHRMAHSQHR